jgi:hypothetical protein
MSILGIALPLLGGGGAIGLALFFLGPQKVLAFIVANWKPLAIGAVLLLGFLYVRHLQNEAKDARADSARWQGLFHQEKAAFAIEKVSLDGALVRINDNNRRIKAAADELAREKQEAAAADARANARYEATGASVKRLEQSAATKGLPPCKVSQEAAHALDGL